MEQRLYKYVSHSYFDRVFASDEYVTLKCSRPAEFNDPYELFMTIDFNERPGALAYYADAVGDLPQLPTTCFSRSPVVLPMWAHYARDLQGFVIEFHEKKLAEAFPESGFGDVDYQDSPHEDLTDLLYRAYEIGKMRYQYALSKAVFSAAYYTKASCWHYEQERRMIVRESEARISESAILIDIPNDCVGGLVAGPRAPQDVVNALRDTATRIGCAYYDLKIGRSSAVPFLLDGEGRSFIFDGSRIVVADKACASCREPLSSQSEICSWCQIEDSHRVEAAARNSYRMLAHAGLLDDYLEGMADIDRKHREG